jgi:acetyl esterase/lipase
MPLLVTADILKLPSSTPTARIPYGDDPNQFADLRLPAGNGPFPVVAILHGGCWAEFADVSYTAPLATTLTFEGWATWNVEYRRVHQEGGGWPNTFTDPGAGIDSLLDAAARYPLDSSRVLVIGHSAGAQLALLTASRARAGALPVRGAISIGGLVDLDRFARLIDSPCRDRLIRVMGGGPDEVPERYRQVSPKELLPLGVPQSLIWGELDFVAPEPIFRGYVLSSEAPSRVVPGAGHHELMSPDQPAYTVLCGEIRRLLA